MRHLFIYFFFSLSIFACTEAREQNAKEEQLFSPTDTSGLAELLEVKDTTRVSAEEKIPENTPKVKTVALDSLKKTPCNLNVLLYTYENIDSLSNKAIDYFLSTLSEECDDNVEFSEFSQELIFEVFGRYHRQVAELLITNQYNLKAIIAELEAPFLDPNVEPMIADFKSLNIKSVKIDSVIQALESANEYLKED